jgi:hypothetical protein
VQAAQAALAVEAPGHVAATVILVRTHQLVAVVAQIGMAALVNQAALVVEVLVQDQ